MELKFILESLLFSAQKPLSVKELRDVLANAAEQEGADATVKSLKKVKESDLVAALEQLAAEHSEAKRSYRLVCVAGAWQFVTQPEFSPWLRALVGVKARPPRLSQPALETLAIIAYRQPIKRAEVEQIRGVNVDGTMQTIMERGLVKDGRLVRLRVHLPDYPGALHRLTGILAQHRANIVETSYDRAYYGVNLGDTAIDITMETRGPDHIAEIISALGAAGYVHERIL